jgi:hypothetical protein
VAQLMGGDVADASGDGDPIEGGRQPAPSDALPSLDPQEG